jgi:hypothetical protein
MVVEGQHFDMAGFDIRHGHIQAINVGRLEAHVQFQIRHRTGRTRQHGVTQHLVRLGGAKPRLP